MSEALAWVLRTARRHTLALACDVAGPQRRRPDERGERQPAWLLGHVLLGDVYLLSLLDAAPLPPDFGELLASFGPGAPPTGEASDSPAIHALVERLADAGELRVAAVREMTPEDLSRTTPDAFLARTQPTIEHHLHALVFHEGYHGGQLASWRARHGLAPVPWALAPGTASTDGSS